MNEFPNAPLRIAQLANFYSETSGGLRTAIGALGRGYARAGHERFLIVPGPEDSWCRDELGVTVTLRAPRLTGHYRMLLDPRPLLRALDYIKPTTVEVSDKATMTVAARWARRHGSHSVLFSHEQLDEMLRRRVPWHRARVGAINALYRRLDPRYDDLVVTSEFARREFVRAGVDRCTVVPLGVDLDTFHPNRRPADSGVDRIPRLVHAGRLSLEKRPDLAIATAVELHRRGVPFSMHVYGDGPDRAELVRLAGSAPITFHGFVHGRESLAARLAAADVALSVCPGETFGLSILEALACGTPVVTADRGGGRELISPTSGALAPAEPRALATAVEALLARPRGVTRRAARQRAEQFPWSATVDRMLQLHTPAPAAAPAFTG